MKSLQPRLQLARQKGMTLVVGLIMLVLITLATVASFNMGKTSLDIVGNMQQRSEVISAANNAIQEALSTTRLFTDANDILTNPCGGVPNTRCIDSNGDGTNDVTVTLRGDTTPNPTCVQAKVLLNAELRSDLESGIATKEENAINCMLGVQPGTYAIQGIPTGNSACADSVWEIVAEARDDVTQATVVVTEGAAVRVPATAIATSCP